MNHSSSGKTDELAFRHGKTILLVDVNPDSRDIRAKTLRSLGVTVHCATTASSAWSRYETGSYNLVLLDFGRDAVRAEGLADQIRTRNPRQLVAFFVGGPKYLALSLHGDDKRGLVALKSRGPAAAIAPAKSIDFGQEVRLAEAEADAERRDDGVVEE